MINFLLTIFGKTLSKFIQVFHLGNGSTWPGHIALTLNKNFIRDMLQASNIKIIVVAGTNGKTTTTKLIKAALEANEKSVLQNQSGANLLNGIASTLILNSDAFGKLEKDFAIFEIDENNLPLLLKQITPDYLVLLNLFRDQLDRYGEVNSIIQKWTDVIARNEAISIESPNSSRDDMRNTTFIINADDPQIAYFGEKLEKERSKKIPSPSKGEDQGEGGLLEKSGILTYYFGFHQTKNHEARPDHAADSIYCPNCGEKLTYKTITYSHLGNWYCPHCKLTRPTPHLSDFPYFPLSGQYNQYNTLAAALTLERTGLDERSIVKSFRNFQPAFGRQEKITYKNKTVQLFLSKNPTSFNQSFETIKNLGAKNILLILNDRIPDGRDVSWIWDTDLEGIKNFKNIFIAGDRVYDMALRIKYQSKTFPVIPVEAGIQINQNQQFRTFENLKEAIDTAVEETPANGTLFILPTYSAMLDTRKILTGKKIL